ncbi:ABC transporter ATP-binding protein [Calidifontibacillus oryziterrae]|uniref:ABC transporter ATP-binding protein n=1 Tax=Calidifontibacillus oryziterrae TaxID=1191699 RepID=UPI00030764EA|nr:ABC transporter ATP-binding protein [Calidifontibacillus oryziterrae]
MGKNNRNSTLLTVDNIGKQFGGLKVLNSINFEVAKGERIGIIGPNGAGKTTLFNIIAGDLEPTHGEIFYKGLRITKVPNYKRVRQGIVRTFQKNNLLTELTVLDNLLLVLQRKMKLEKIWFQDRLARKFSPLYEKADTLLEKWGLSDRKDSFVRNLSYGEQRQVEIVLGIATEPDVLLLDEPTAGMSNAETKYILNLLNSLSRELTILIIEHDMDVIFGLADKIIVLYNGEVLMEGDRETVLSDERVREIYLGEEAANASG